VVAIVEKLIASDRAQRYASADAVWDPVTTWAIPAREVRMLGTVVRACRPEVVVPRGGLLTKEEVERITGAGR
jgi:hypothetical protein